MSFSHADAEHNEGLADVARQTTVELVTGCPVQQTGAATPAGYAACVR